MRRQRTTIFEHQPAFGPRLHGKRARRGKKCGTPGVEARSRAPAPGRTFDAALSASRRGRFACGGADGAEEGATASRGAGRAAPALRPSFTREKSPGRADTLFPAAPPGAAKERLPRAAPTSLLSRRAVQPRAARSSTSSADKPAFIHGRTMADRTLIRTACAPSL